MKKRKLNALIAAGCLTFLAPLSAHADTPVTTYEDVKSDKLNQEINANTTFTQINVSGSDTLLQIKTIGGTFEADDKSDNNVNLSGSSILEFSAAVKNIVLGDNSDTEKTNVLSKGTNIIGLDSNLSTTGLTLDLGSVGFVGSDNKSLKLISTFEGGKNKGTINAAIVNMNATTDATQTLTLTGDGDINIADVVVASKSQSNEIVTNTSGTYVDKSTSEAVFTNKSGGQRTINNITLTASDDSSNKTKLTLTSSDPSETGSLETFKINHANLENNSELKIAGDKKLTLGEVAIINSSSDTHNAYIETNNNSTKISTVNMDAKTNLHTAGTATTAISTINAQKEGSNILNANSTKTTVSNLNVGDNSNAVVFTYSADNTSGSADEIKNATVNKGSSLSLKAVKNDIVQSSLDASDKGINLQGGAVTTSNPTAANTATLELTGGENYESVQLKKVSATGEAVINNSNANTDTTLGNLNVNTYTESSTNKPSRLTVNSKTTSGTKFSGATVAGKVGSDPTGKDNVLSTLVLNADEGAISDSDDINLNGAGVLRVSGSKGVTLGTIVAKNNDNKLENNIADALYSVEVNANDAKTQSSLEVVANQNTKISGKDGKIDITGTTGIKAVLKLNASSGDITLQDNLNLNGQARLDLDGSKNIKTSDTGKQVNVSASGNEINVKGSGSADEYSIKDIVFNNPTTTGDKKAELTLTNVNSKYEGNIKFNADDNTLKITNNNTESDPVTTNVGNLTFGTSGKTATLKALKDNVAFKSATVGTYNDGSAKAQQLTLKLDAFTDSTKSGDAKYVYGTEINGESVTLDGGKLELTAVAKNTNDKQITTDRSIALSDGVKVGNNGGTVQITKPSDLSENTTFVLDKIELDTNTDSPTATPLKLTLDNVKTTDYTNGITQSADVLGKSRQNIEVTLQNASELKSFASKEGQTLTTIGVGDSDNKLINNTADRNVGNISAGDGTNAGKLTLDAQANTSYNEAVVNENSTLILAPKVAGNIITGNKTTIYKDGTLTINKPTDYTEDTVNLGTLKVMNNATLSGISANYTGFELGEETVTLNLIDTNLAKSGIGTSDLSEKNITFQTADEAKKSSTIGDFTFGNGTVTLDAAGGNLNTGDLKLAGGGTLNFGSGADTISISKITATGVPKNTINNKASVTNNMDIHVGDASGSSPVDGNLTINNTTAATHGHLYVGDTKDTKIAKGDLTINADANTTYTDATVIGRSDAKSSLTLNAKTGADVNYKDKSGSTTEREPITTITTELNNGALAINTTSGYTGNVNVGALTLKNNVELTNVKDDNYTSLALTDLVKATLNNSEVKPTGSISVANGKTLTFETGSNNTSSVSEVGNISLAAGTDTSTNKGGKLSLSSTAGELKSGIVAMNGYTELETSGTAKLTVGNVTATGTNNKIVAANTDEDKSTINTLTVGTVTGTTPTYTTGDLTLQSDAISDSTAKTTKFNGAVVSGDLTKQSTQTGALSTLTLNANQGNIQSTEDITLNGNAKLVTSGGKNITFDKDIKVAGTGNTIQNDNTSGTAVNFGNLSVGTSSAKADLTVTANKATTIAGATVTGKDTSNKSTLTLNASGGNINSTADIALNGNANLTTSGIGVDKVTFSDAAKGIKVTGTGNTITNSITDETYNFVNVNSGSLEINPNAVTNITAISGTTASGNSSLTINNSTSGKVNATTTNLNGSNNNTVTLNNSDSDTALGAVTVNGNVALNNVQSTNYSSLALGTGTTNITLTGGSDVKNGSSALNIASGQELTINNTGSTASDVGAINMAQGTAASGSTAADTTKLTLNASDAKLAVVGKLTMNGENEVNLAGSKDIEFTNEILALNANNVIKNSNANSKIGAINVGQASGTPNNGDLTINSSANTTITGATTLVNGSDIALNIADTVTSATKTTFTTISATGVDNNTGLANINLNTGTAKSTGETPVSYGTIEGTKVTLNGNTQVTLSGAGTVNLTGEEKTIGGNKYTVGVEVSGKDNYITNNITATTSDVNLQTIQFVGGTTKADNEIYTANLKQGRDYTNIVGTGTMYDNGTDYGDLEPTDNLVIVEAGTGSFDNLTVAAGKELTLNTKNTTSGWGQRANPEGSTSDNYITLNEGSTLNLNDNYVASTSGLGSFSLNGANVLVNGDATVNNGGASVALPDVKISDGKTLNTNGAFTYDVTQNGTNTINTAGTTGIGTITTKGTDVLTVNALNGGTTTINNVAKSSTGTNNINLVLDASHKTGTTADAGDIVYSNSAKLALTNGDSVTIKDNGTQKVTMSGLSITGNAAGVTLDASTTNANSTFGEIALSDAVLNVTGLTTTNHSFKSDGVTGTNTINTNNSNINDIATGSSNANANLTFNANGNGTVLNDITIQGKDSTGSVLTLNTGEGTSGYDIANAGQIALNGNSKLVTDGNKNITGLDITVTGTNTIDVSGNTNIAFASGKGIELNDAILTTIGLDASGKDIFKIAEGSTNNTIKADKANLGNVDVEKDATFNVEATSASGVQFGTITLDKGTGTVGTTTTLTTLNLTPTSSNISGTNLTVKGNTETNINVGASQVSLSDDLNVEGTGNTINNKNANTFSTVGNLNYTAANAALTLNNADNSTGDFSFGSVEANAGSALTVTKGDVNLGAINFDTVGVTFALNVNGGTTTISKDFTNTEGIVKNVTLNANSDGSIVKTNKTTLSDGDTLTLGGTSTINLGDVKIGGKDDASTLTIANKNDNISLGNVEISGLGTLDSSNDLIDTVKVKTIKSTAEMSTAGTYNTGTWSLDISRDDSNNVTSDSMTFTGTQNDKLSFSIDYVINDKPIRSGGYFVEYVKLVDSDDYVLNSKLNTDKENVFTVGSNGVRYTYIDNSDTAAAVNNYYDANTVRITNYNINSDKQLNYLTRQGERTYDMTGGTQYSSGQSDDIVTALPNMGVTTTEGVNNIYTINSYSAIDGRGDRDDNNQRTQLFKVDSTVDDVARTMNFNGNSFNNAVSDNVYYKDFIRGAQDGRGSALQVISDIQQIGSAVAKVTINPYSTTEEFSNLQGYSNAKDYFDNYDDSPKDKLNPDAYIEVQDSTNPNKLNITKDVAFNSNASVEKGGAIYASGAVTQIITTSITDKGVQFTNNTAGLGVRKADQTVESEIGKSIIVDKYYADADGGAIYLTDNAKYISDGNTTFENNTATGNGGALYNNGAYFAATGTTVFDSNTADAHGTSSNRATNNNGGALYNTNDSIYVTIGDTTFEKNTATGNGGAIFNDSMVALSNAEFSNNKAKQNGGALYNTNGATFDTDGNTTFKRNLAVPTGVTSLVTHSGNNNGGAIYNQDATVKLGKTDGSSTTNFVNNEAFGNGGAVYSNNNDFKTYGNVNYNYNTAVSGVEQVRIVTTEGDILVEKKIAGTGNGGALSVTGGSNVTMNAGTHTFTNNKAGGLGGAIYMKGIAEVKDEEGKVITEQKSSVVHITANGTSVFQGNKQNAEFVTDTVPEGLDTNTWVVDADCHHVVNKTTGEHYTTSAEDNAIYFDGDSTLVLETTGKGNFQINDKIASNKDSKNNVIIQKGTVYYNNDMSDYNGTFNLNSGTAHFNLAGGPTTFGSSTNRADYILNGGSTLDVRNGSINPIYANSLDLSGTSASNPAYMQVDLDLSTATADYFSVSQSTSGNILVSDIDVQGNSDEDYMFVPIVEGEGDADPNVDVDTNVTSITSENGLDEYDVSGTTNGLILQHVGQDTGVLAPQVAVNARLAGQLDLLNDVLHRVDQIAENRYFHKIERNNLYAADPNVIDDRHIDNGYTPYVNQEDGGCTWVKGNATIEHNSPSGQDGYKNRAYNAFIGYETPVATMKNGWDLINTVFGGYQGSFQDYDNIENWQNGGSGGYMANLYHNNFFAGGVVMMGGTNVDVKDSGKYARDMNFGLFDIAASTRVGYNVGMGNHWLFQPMLTTSYIYITGIDRHNAKGEDVYMDGTNTIQVAPGFKIVGNYSGWKPYVLFDYTWPIIAKTAATVNDADLPDLGLRSYIEYGLGLRKDMGERFTGHVEAVMRNGGRTGVSFQGGLVFKF